MMLMGPRRTVEHWRMVRRVGGPLLRTPMEHSNDAEDAIDDELAALAAGDPDTGVCECKP